MLVLALPACASKTGFHPHKENPVEKIILGKLSVEGATAQFYFTKGS
jgi:hypothetical protein